jgi:hypothetical protein
MIFESRQNTPPFIIIIRKSCRSREIRSSWLVRSAKGLSVWSATAESWFIPEIFKSAPRNPQISPDLQFSIVDGVLLQGRQELSASGVELGHPEKLPKTRPTNPRTRVDQGVMTQSCPTPPQTRRKFFLSPKALRSPFSQRNSRQPPVDSASSGE